MDPTEETVLIGRMNVLVSQSKRRRTKLHCGIARKQSQQYIVKKNSLNCSQF